MTPAPAGPPDAPRPDDLRLAVLGWHCRVTGTDLVARSRLAELWAALRHEGEAVDPVRYVVDPDGVWVDGDPLPAGDGAAARVAAVGVDLNARALRASSRLAVHAGVVARAGEALAVPGASGAGKSTLVAALGRHGWDYLSDEALCLGYDDALAWPYPRPLALAPDGLAALDPPALGPPALGRPGPDGHPVTSGLFAPGELGLRVGTAALPLRWVVLAARDPAADPPRLVPAPAARAVPVLLERSFNAYTRPADALRLLGRALAAAQVWRLSYRDAPAAAALLGNVLG